MSAVFLTGGAGFIGRQLLRDLVARGHCVTALQYKTPLSVQGSTAIEGDLGAVSALERVLDKTDIVIHAAAVLDPVNDAVLADRINHRATVELACAAAAAGVQTFVFLSSVAAIGFPARGGLVSEATPCAPTTFYGRAKRDAEIALLAGEYGGMRVVIIRPPTVYGPEERRNFLSLTRAVARRRIFVPGSGKNRMSFCHVENLSSATIALAMHGDARGLVHVSDATPITFLETIESIRAAIGQRGPLPRVPLRVADALAWGMQSVLGRAAPLTLRRLRTLTADFALDTRKCSRLGVVGSIAFRTGVHQTVAAYRAAGVLEAP